ncbi:MAG: mechanosensitive ion channel [Oscillospiraceae bacterium]|nr:mechanosensitive ion channel [Oscillospiraceae bacterium]
MNTINAWLSGMGGFLLATVLPALLIFVVGVVLIRLVLKLVAKALTKSKLEKAAHSLIKTVIRAVLYGLLALIAASRLGIDVTGIVALASVLTLAISLSVQNALTNLISGFTLLYTKPFSSGDFVEIAGQSGTVQEIGLTYTKLSTGDNKSVFIPNGAVTSAEIVNYTVLGTRRVDVPISAAYSASVEQVLAALRQAGKVPTALEEKEPFAAVKGYGDSAINYVLQVWSTADDYWTTLFAVNEKVKQVFDENGIEMTYPHLNVHLDK